jgi:putative methyltransferase (TIGR04325 family)
MNIKVFAKKWLPPALISHLKPLLKYGIYYSGNYPDWATAEMHTSGYNSTLILERVKQARLKAMAGDAKYERDSVLFEEVQHSFPVLAGLLRAAIENGDQLSVLDFGGSLGSSYFQCRDFLSLLPSLKWGVVEQEHFVECGREQFENEHLKFYYTIAECIQQAKPNVVLLSSVLQYLPEPYAVLDELITSEIPYIIIDHTPFSKNEEDRITVQQVPASIYAASYPCKIFGEQSLHKIFHGRYEVLAWFDSSYGSAISNGLEFAFCGIILRKI